MGLNRGSCKQVLLNKGDGIEVLARQVLLNKGDSIDVPAKTGTDEIV